MALSPAECRGARAMLRISQADLAALAKVSRQTVVDFEREVRVPYPNNLESIERVLEKEGIEFFGYQTEGSDRHIRRKNTSLREYRRSKMFYKPMFLLFSYPKTQEDRVSKITEIATFVGDPKKQYGFQPAEVSCDALRKGPNGEPLEGALRIGAVDDFAVFSSYTFAASAACGVDPSEIGYIAVADADENNIVSAEIWKEFCQKAQVDREKRMLGD